MWSMVDLINSFVKHVEHSSKKIGGPSLSLLKFDKEFAQGRLWGSSLERVQGIASIGCILLLVGKYISTKIEEPVMKFSQDGTDLVIRLGIDNMDSIQDATIEMGKSLQSLMPLYFPLPLPY